MRNSTAILLVVAMMLSSFSLGDDGGEPGNQRAFYECSDPLPITPGLFPIIPDSTYFHFNTELSPKDLKTLNFVWLEDDPEGYFTGYLINTTDSTLTSKRQDGSLIMIQEAPDSRGTWQPIEYWVHSGCGNSYFDPLELPPYHYVMIPIRKYAGGLKTKIRLKWKLGGQILYSGPFEGTIAKDQFKKETNDVHGILYHGPASYLEDN